MHRNARVASELIAMAVLNALPLHQIRALRDNTLSKLLRKDQALTVADVFNPRIEESDGKKIREPLLKAHQCYGPFIAVLEKILLLDPKVINNLKDYRMTVHHPAAHASAHIFSYHFEGFSKDLPLGGAIYDSSRHESYCSAADDLVCVVSFHADILDALADHLSGHK
jgi:hypothetical protein